MICPLCKSQTSHREGSETCDSCGGKREFSQVTSNEIWILNGQVVLAEKDVADQRNKAMMRYPEATWGDSQ